MSERDSQKPDKRFESRTDASDSLIFEMEFFCGEPERKPRRPNIPRFWPEGMPYRATGPKPPEQPPPEAPKQS
jgi:hypothetical protein